MPGHKSSIDLIYKHNVNNDFSLISYEKNVNDKFSPILNSIRLLQQGHENFIYITYKNNVNDNVLPL